LVRQVLFGIALFLSSAGGLVVEIVAGRLIAPYVGMSLYTWTAIIAVVLAGLSGGHWIGGRLAGADVGEDRACRRLAFALALASVSSLAALALLRILSGPLLTSGLGPVAVVIVLTTALFLLPSLFVGIVAPILTKLAVDRRPAEPGPVIGRMYALGTLGSIGGTLGAGFLFISWIGSTGTIIAVAFIYAALALLFSALGRGRAGAATAVLRCAALLGLGAWGQSVRAYVSPCMTESDYFCIRVDDFTESSGRPSALMALDHLVHSINDRDDPEILYSPYIHFVDEYHRRRLGKRAVAEPLAAFFIGGGGFTLPRAWAQAFPGARLTVAEIDPAVTAAAEEHMWLDTGHAAFDIRHRDARALLQSMPVRPTFDVVFGDAFRDISVPAHLVTREFHREVAKRLKTGGFYAVNVVDHGGEPRFLAALVRTLATDFSVVEVWAEADELEAALKGTGQRVTYVVIAGETGADRPVLTATHGIVRHWRQWPLPALSERVGGDLPLLTDDFAPVDRLMAHLLTAPEE